ncbi:hypothetical protein K7432_000672 [Basidiobolus ranarum]|uniref:Uncharacterized protein n=1 Tax=Basidiobolus ranarum TaxID=34480 RepID=A0ABR2WAW1_9FUNG
MLKSLIIAFTLLFSISHALPMPSESGTLINQSLPEIRQTDQIDSLSELQLAEDDALFEAELMHLEDDEDYDFTPVNSHNGYLAMSESIWKQ